MVHRPYADCCIRSNPLTASEGKIWRMDPKTITHLPGLPYPRRRMRQRKTDMPRGCAAFNMEGMKS